MRPAAAKPAKAEKFSGTVDKVDEAGKAIVIKGKKDEKTIVIDDKQRSQEAEKRWPLPT